METIEEWLQKEPWQPVPKGRFLAFSAGLAIFIAAVLLSEPGFVMCLDSANLVFHEAGHFCCRYLGPSVELYGGTLGQLVFPLVLIGSFWRQGLPLSCAVGWIWLFENFFNIARYVADARAGALELVGGGEHDWNTILARWDVLAYDTTIAAVIRGCGWAGIAIVWGWLGWRTWFRANSARSAGVIGSPRRDRFEDETS